MPNSDSRPGQRPERRLLARADCRPHCGRSEIALRLGKRNYAVSLLDLHEQGARLRFMDLSSSAAVSVGDDCGFCISIAHRGLQSGTMPCRIVWKLGAEFGVCFAERMKWRLPDLQSAPGA